MSCSSCGSSCSPCHCDECDSNNEPLASALNNFITAFFGTLTKSCVDGKVVWILPCDLDTGIPGFPRLAGEGLACYFTRYMGVGISGTVTVVTDVSYNSPILQETKMSMTFTNGLLTAIGTPVTTTVTIAEACP